MHLYCLWVSCQAQQQLHAYVMHVNVTLHTQAPCTGNVCKYNTLTFA